MMLSVVVAGFYLTEEGDEGGMTSRLILEVCIVIKVIRIDAVSRVIGMAIELVICIIRVQ